jgi:hypothetical protein
MNGGEDRAQLAPIQPVKTCIIAKLKHFQRCLFQIIAGFTTSETTYSILMPYICRRNAQRLERNHLPMKLFYPKSV